MQAGLGRGAAVGISLAGIFGLLLLVFCMYVRYLKKEEEKARLPTNMSMALSTQDGNGIFSYSYSSLI